VDSDGSKLVAVRRTDLDLETDPRARAMAYADNRVGQVDLAWDPSQIAADLEAGLDLSGMFYPEELSAILEQAADDIVKAEAYRELDEQLDALDGMEEITIGVVVPAKHEAQVKQWLANGEAMTGPGMGKGVLRRCGLL